jgi:hypothetical protein
MKPFVAFHFGLVQDVGVLRDLVRLAASSTSVVVKLLVSSKFAELDDDGRWMAEIHRLGAEIGVEPFVYESPFDCLIKLGSGRGLIIAGSESDSRAHREAHQLFRAVPGRMRTVTLQHGFECVGFLHNARHDATAGRAPRFAADIAVGWFDPPQLYSVSPTERDKIFVAGPPSMIVERSRQADPAADLPALVCENLHSVRFVNGRMREAFLETFLEFARRLEMVGQRLVLRPHPAGRFTKRKGVALPANVEVSDAPLYDIDLTSFSYVISAPSTILFDFALSGVPVATWVDTEGFVDAHNFEGLAQVATIDDWWRFNSAARLERAALVARQDAFLQRLKLPDDVRGRYVQLLALA